MEFTRPVEWITAPFSRGSSQHRDRTQVSRMAGGFFTVWATQEAPNLATQKVYRVLVPPPGTETVPLYQVLGHVALPAPPRATQLCRLQTQLSLGQSYHGQNPRPSWLSVSLQHCQLPFCPGDCGRILYQGGDAPCKNPGAYWPVWIAMPF